MAEEYINGIVRDIQNMSAMGISNVTLKIETALALLKELETVRAERDALATALEAVRGECNWDYHSLDAMLRNITHIVDTALNTQPQAEWTPRKPNDAAFLRPGHYVRVKATGERLRIDRVSLNSDASDGKAWAGDWFRADALEPTD